MNLAQGLADIDKAFDTKPAENHAFNSTSTTLSAVASMADTAAVSTLKIESNFKMYTSPMANGNQSYKIAANLGKAGEALSGALGIGGAALDVYGLATGQMSPKEGMIDGGLGVGALTIPWVGPAAAVGYSGYKMGELMQDIPTGGGSTVGNYITNRTANAVAPYFEPKDPSTVGDF